MTGSENNNRGLRSETRSSNTRDQWVRYWCVCFVERKAPLLVWIAFWAGIPENIERETFLRVLDVYMHFLMSHFHFRNMTRRFICKRCRVSCSNFALMVLGRRFGIVVSMVKFARKQQSLPSSACAFYVKLSIETLIPIPCLYPHNVIMYSKSIGIVSIKALFDQNKLGIVNRDVHTTARNHCLWFSAPIEAG